MAITTEVANDLVEQAIKSEQAEGFLAGSIQLCKIAGIETRNLIRVLQDDKRINYEKILEILKIIKQ